MIKIKKKWQKIERIILGSIVQKEQNKFVLFKKYGDGSEPPLCLCGCGKPVCRNVFYPHEWNKYLNNHHDHKIKEMHKKWKEENPKEYKEYLKKVQDGAKKYHVYMKKNYPEEYSKFQSENAIKFHRKNPNFAHYHVLKTHRLHPEIGLNAYEKRIKNAPWYFMGIPFGSHQESDIAKLRFELFGIIPIFEVNCHIKIKNKEFDFEQFGFVHEHHPEHQWKGQTEIHPRDEYFKQRRQILDSNGHKKSELIVTTNMKEARSMYHALARMLDYKEVVSWI